MHYNYLTCATIAIFVLAAARFNHLPITVVLVVDVVQDNVIIRIGHFSTLYKHADEGYVFSFHNTLFCTGLPRVVIISSAVCLNYTIHTLLDPNKIYARPSEMTCMYLYNSTEQREAKKKLSLLSLVFGFFQTLLLY